MKIVSSSVKADYSGWKKVQKNLLRGNAKSLELGIFDKYYGPENDNLPVAQVAAWNEFGHANGGWFEGTSTPSRPFMRMYLFKLEQDGKLVGEMAWQLYQVATGKMSWDQFYKHLGEEAKSDLQKVVNAWEHPENSPATVYLKGFNDPLIETGTLLDSIDYRIGGA